jgi:phosphopantothenoylcysteine decarboxylase / phosphopantothenate---cysteine ligase
MIIANDVSAETGVFGGDHNKVHIVTAQGVEAWPDLTKRDVALRLMQKLSDLLAR